MAQQKVLFSQTHSNTLLACACCCCCSCIEAETLGYPVELT